MKELKSRGTAQLLYLILSLGNYEVRPKIVNRKLFYYIKRFLGVKCSFKLGIW